MNRTLSKSERKLGWAIAAVLFLGCLFVLRPFVSAFLWAVVLCSTSWPLYSRLVRAMGNRRTLASLTMTLGMFLIVLMPLFIVAGSLADNVNDLTAATKKWMDSGPPMPPEWLGKVPLVGTKAMTSWQNLAGDTAKLMEKVNEWIPTITRWVLKGGWLLGHGLLQLTLSIFIAFFLFRDGVALAERLNAAIARIASDKGVRLLTVATKTVRGVVYGILGTALVQGVMLGIGLLIAGVPGAALLALLTCFASIIPVVGVGLVWIPADIWLFHQGASGWGIFMIVWGIIVGNIDNVIKPLLISQGSDMPFILIFFGVIGGALAFGFIGVFLGPTLLAVGFRLVEEWTPKPSTETHPGSP